MSASPKVIVQSQAIVIVIEKRLQLFDDWQKGNAQDLVVWDKMNRVIRYLTDPETVEAEGRARSNVSCVQRHRVEAGEAATAGPAADVGTAHGAL